MPADKSDDATVVEDIGEFDVIRRYFAPLSRDFPGALQLTDDAAIFDIPAGRQVVVSNDMLVADVHFPADATAEQVAEKMLGANLSDLAAMGATPYCYTLAIAWTPAQNTDWISGFAAALQTLQQTFGLSLAGGDTVRTPGPLTLSVAIFGHVAPGEGLRRAGARAGDLIYVSGTIGDAFLGLQAHRNISSLTGKDRDWVLSRYHKPSPRVALGMAAGHLATAGIDVSDGLLADLSHILSASSVGAAVNISKIPLSAAAKKAIDGGEASVLDLAAGGDDYELIVTVPPAAKKDFVQSAREAGVSVSEIGEITPDPGLTVTDESGNPIDIQSFGWQHF